MNPTRLEKERSVIRSPEPRGRDRASTMGGLFGDLKLEGLGAAQMYDVGEVTDEILAAQMEILVEHEVSEWRGHRG
jgi:hypothetical protein